VLKNEQLRQQMSKFARDRFQGVLAWEISEDNLLRAYNELINGTDLVEYENEAWQQ
jgi:glycosyltransferase involved in cell wall biosynthesis